MPRLFECSYEDIQSLNAVELTGLLRKLLYLEARKFGIAASAVHASLKIDVPDGGEDGRIQWKGNPEHTTWLPSRFCLFQCKATALDPNDCKREVLVKGKNQLKPRVKEVLDAGGVYILFYGRDCNPQHQEPRIAKIREAIREAGESYADTCKLTILDANRIAAWASEYLSSVVQVFEAAHKPLPPTMESWTSWSHFGGFSQSYVSGDGSRDGALVQICAYLSKGPKRTARIVGLSGLGKSRLALEVFRPPTDPTEDIGQQFLHEQVVYIDAEEVGSNIFRAIHAWRQEGVRGILVVDSCDKELHNKLQKHVEHEDSELGLLTIGPHPEAGALSTEAFPYVELGPIDDKVVAEMLKQHHATLPEADLNFIVKTLACGFPQMAVLIADARLQNRDIRAVVEDHLLRKLLGTPPDSESPAFRVISHCALFEHLGVSEPVANEYKWVAAFAELSPDRFYEHMMTFKNRGILSKHGNFVQVRPAPLAMRLAADWWSRCSPEKASRLIEGDIPERLAEALCERIRVLDYVPEVRQFVENLCGEQGPFGQAKVLNSELGSRLFRSLVEVNPDATANALAKAFAGWSIDELKSIGPGRRHLVWALQKLCFWKTTFPRAARVLLTFAAAENEDWSNNATGIFLGLFKLLLSGTQADPRERLQLIDDALTSQDQRCRLLAARALGSALQTRQFFGMSGPEQQGSRFPEQEWRPKLYKEAFDYWREALGRLKELALHDGSLGDAARNEIGHHIRELASAGRVKELDDALSPIIEKLEGFWPQALGQVQDIIEYDFERMPEEGKQFVRRWEELLQPRQLDKRLTLIVTEAPWEHRKDESGNYVDVAAEKASTLAEEISGRLDRLVPLLPNLLAGGQRQAYVFGRRLGQVTPRLRELVFASLNALERIDPAIVNSSLLMGLFSAAQETDSPLFEEIFTRVEERDGLVSEIVNIIRASRLSEQYLDRILRLVEIGRLPPNKLQGLSYGRGLDHISASYLSTFCDRLVALGTNGSWAALDVIFMYAHGDPKKWEDCAASFRKIVLVPEMLLLGSRKDRGIDTHAFQVTIEKLLKRGDAELAIHISREIVKVARQESARYDLDQVLSPVIGVLFSDYAETAWPVFAERLTENWRTELHLTHLLGARFGMGDNVGLISSLKLDFLLDWCDRNPEDNPALLGRMVKVAESKEGEEPRFTSLARALIDRYGENEKVLDALGVNMGSYSWVGSLVPYYEEQIKLVSPLLQHPIKKVRQWAEKLIDYSRKQAQRERDRDAARAIGLY